MNKIQRFRAAIHADPLDHPPSLAWCNFVTVGFSKAAFVRKHPEEAAAMLDALTETFVDYIEEIRKVPVDGVLYATNACIIAPSSRGISDAGFRAFHKPYDLRLLQAMDGLVRIVHAHGSPLDLTRILDYPCESRLQERSLPEIRAEVADALAQAGGPRNFILSPGCNVASGIALRSLVCMRDAAKRE